MEGLGARNQEAVASGTASDAPGLTGRKLFDCQEMFRHACTFCECADMAQNKHHHDTADIGWYVSPAVINSAFACEVFIKALLIAKDIKAPKTHKLKKLFDKLPEENQERIRQFVCRNDYQAWNNCFGFDNIDEISDAFVDWRYSYEIVGKKRAMLEINSGFLENFRNALRDLCCRSFFGLTWEEYKKLRIGEGM